MRAGEWEEAHAWLARALTQEPAELTVARDLCRVAEKLRRYDEYVQLGEVCADAIAAYDPLAAAARFKHFAEVLTAKLDRPQQATVMLEKALALVPEDADTRRALIAAWAERPETAARALEAALAAARTEPSDGVALAGAAAACATLARDVGSADAARLAERGRIVASLAAYVAPGRVSPPAPARLARAVPSAARDRAAAPGATGPLARLLALLCPWLEPLFPADLGRRGATPADRLAPPRAPALRTALEDAARALATRPHAVLLTAKPGAEVAVENTQPPAAILSAGVATLPERALPFVAARTLDLVQHGWALAGKFAPRDLAILLELACRFAGGAPASSGLPPQRAAAFLGPLEQRVPSSIRNAARRLGAAATAELGAGDPRELAAALRRTASRVALVYAGDPGEALRALARLERPGEAGDLDPAQALGLPDLRDLALFALSDPFLELRLSVLG
jgi:tetratricopeptide (TPR) repeat protein